MLEGVVFRVQVVLQVGRGPEVFPAVGAPVVLVAIVFLELLVAVEELYIRQNCPPLRKAREKKKKDDGSRGQRGITDLATLCRRDGSSLRASTTYPRRQSHTCTLCKGDDLGSVGSEIGGQLQIGRTTICTAASVSIVSRAEPELMVTYLIVHEAIPMLRAQVMAQVGCVLEVLLTVGAPTVLIAIMFLEFLVAVE